MGTHLMDVASTDQHTVKPWFDGKLDFSPPVTDFAAQGFPLLGGRLDYIENRPAAALVYGRRKHVINLFVWPAAPGREVTPQDSAQQGYNTICWSRAAMNFCAVSDVSPADLREFTGLLQK
jgi:anti-sigma factor RsiW